MVYTRHGRPKKARKKKTPKGFGSSAAKRQRSAQKKRKRKVARQARPAPMVRPARRRRRYASMPRRPPAEAMLRYNPYHLIGSLAQDLMQPQRPGPNWITQKGPPFLPYDPWAEQRKRTQHAEQQMLERLTRQAQARARPPDDGAPAAFPDYGE